MTSPALTDLLERLRTMAEVIEELLVEEGAAHQGAWAKPLVEALDHLGRAGRPAATGEERVALVDAALDSIARARGVDGRPAGLEPNLADLLAFGAQSRARALDVAAFVGAAAAGDAPGERPFRVGRGRPEVIRGLELPAPAPMPKEASFQPEREVRLALSANAIDPATMRRFMAASDEEDEEPVRGPVEPMVPFAPPRGGAAEIAQLRRLARDCLEDLAALGSLRRPESDLPWSFAEHFEERLLASVEALVALECPRWAGGPRLSVASELWSYVREWDAPDPGRAFAFAFPLACSELEAGARWIGVTLRRAHGRITAALEDAIALGASPHLAPVLAASLSSEADVGRLRVVLEALRRRGGAEPSFVVPLLAHPASEVAASAVRLLALDGGELARSTIRDLPRADPHLVAEASVALARLGDRQAPAELRSLLGSTAADAPSVRARAVAARALAAMGDPRDTGALVEHCARQRDQVDLLGFHGMPSHAALLLATLREAPDEVSRRSAGWGLTRLLGPPPGTRLDAGPLLDPGPWERHIAASDRASRQRHQLGRPVEASTAVTRLAAELCGESTLQRDRAQLLLELELSLGRTIQVDLEGWVGVQREVFASLG